MTAANSNTTSVLPDQRMPIIDRYRRWSPVWWRFLKPLLESVNQNSETLTAVSADLTTAQASITTEQTVRANADGALASQITVLSAAYQLADTNLSASVSAEAVARASGDGALATQIDTVETTVGANTVSIQTLSQSVDGFSGRWAVSLNANNRVVGMIRLDGTATQSTVAVLADKFVIVHPTNNGDAIQAFITGLVNGVPTVGINGNLVVDDTILARHIVAGSITAAEIAADAVTVEKINVTTLDGISANLGDITAGVMRSTDNKFRIDLNNKTLTIET